MSKKRRHSYVGSYVETSAPPIELPHTLANFQALLMEGARPDSRFTHQQIKNWAADFWWTQWERPFALGYDVPVRMKEAAEIAQEIEMQWDMYLENTYTLPELQRMDFSSARLPEAWFGDWLARVERLKGATQAE